MRRLLAYLATIAFIGVCMITSTAAVASAEKPITLTFAAHVAQGAWGAQHGLEPWFDQIEKATHGRVKIDRYYSQTMVKIPDTLEALKTGVVDMAMVGPAFYPGQLPLNEVSHLPFLGAKSSEQSSVVTWQLYEKFPEVKAEHTKFNKVPLVFLNCDYHPMTTEKGGPIRTLEDFKGKKMRTVSGPPTDAMLALGAVPLYIPAPDLYMSLEKGVIDGANLPWEVVGTGWNLAEVTAYQTAVNLFYAAYSVSINLDTWKRLPPDIQEVIQSLSGLKGTRIVSSNYFDTAEKPGREIYAKMAAEGKIREIIEVSDAEVARWVEVAGKPVWKTWVEKMKDKGYPMAQEVLDETLRLIKEYKP